MNLARPIDRTPREVIQILCETLKAVDDHWSSRYSVSLNSPTNTHLLRSDVRTAVEMGAEFLASDFERLGEVADRVVIDLASRRGER